MDISLVGSINIDLVYRVPYIVNKGETLHSASNSVHFGGKGANQAATASQLGANVYLIGKIGKDDFGEQAINNLKNKGVNVDSIRKEGATGQAIIQVTDDGDNAIILFSGANFLVTPKQIEQEADIITSSDVLLLQLEIPLDAVEKAVDIASQHGKIIILNPAPSHELPDSLLKNITFLTPNETELAQLTGIETTTKEDIRSACRLLLDKGVGTIVVTLGSRGSFYMNHGESGWVQALSVDAIDTTGAGDAFNGALAVALCRRESLRNSIVFATKVAAFVVTQMGAQPFIPDSFLE
ncbi:ribokinase [Lysinibacillus sp. NPDC058147]|uniref:ribokinase n=1 Tax=unclassified Lysinibacillus TaxID=2636778 RepID=UPI0036DAFC0E